MRERRLQKGWDARRYGLVDSWGHLLCRKSDNASVVPLTAASSGASARANEADELVTVGFVDQSVAVCVATPASGERTILRRVGRLRRIGELALECFQIRTVQPPVAVAIAANRHHQL